jgi:hypothetical protein
MCIPLSRAHAMDEVKSAALMGIGSFRLTDGRAGARTIRGKAA